MPGHCLSYPGAPSRPHSGGLPDALCQSPSRAHNSCELNATADRLAEQGATLPADQGVFAENDRDFGLEYAKWDPASSLTISTADARTAGLLAFPSAALRKIWSTKLRAERCTRALPSYTADFLRRRDDSRDMLGRAFQDLPPGTIKTSSG